MEQPFENAIRRRTDGSIDIDFYARRASRHRNAARTEVLERATAAVRYAWRYVGRCGARRYPGCVSEKQGRSA